MFPQTTGHVLAKAPVALPQPGPEGRAHQAWVPPDQRFVAGRRLHAHAWSQMGRRKVPASAVEAVLRFGRKAHVRSAHIFVLGRAEVAKAARQGLRLAEWEGLHVVVLADTGAIATVYRSKDLKGLRPQGSRIDQARQAAKARHGG